MELHHLTQSVKLFLRQPLATFAIVASIEVRNGGARGIVISADGSFIYATEPSDAVVISTAANAVVATIPLSGCCAVQMGIQQPRPQLRLSAGLQNAGSSSGERHFSGNYALTLPSLDSGQCRGLVDGNRRSHRRGQWNGVVHHSRQRHRRPARRHDCGREFRL